MSKAKRAGDRRNGRDPESVNLRGFAPPVQNWTRVPNRLFDLVPELTHAELSVLLYLVRHLWGFNENARHLSLDELAEGRRRQDGSRMDAGSGVSLASVKRAVKSLEAAGHIVVWRETTDRGPALNCYALRIRDPQPDEDN